MVLVGEPTATSIPKLSRHRQAYSRLSGLRLMHTHLDGVLLTQEDLMTWSFSSDSVLC